MNDLPPIGAHLVTPRSWYTHHGIHVGDGRVVHYSGFCYGVHGGPITETSLQDFCRGRGFGVRKHRRQVFSAEEIAQRARSRLGEDRYHLLRNNCEHFCEWCVRGRSFSAQVEAWLAYPLLSLVTVLRRVAGRMNGPNGAPSMG